MKKEKRSCLHANYPETAMKCVVCYDGEVSLHTYKATKRKHLSSISVKGGTHRILNGNPLSVTVLQGKAIVQVKGGRPVKYNGSGAFKVPANAWVKITALPFAQFYVEENVSPVLGDGDEGECDIR
jgi:hypothetical protein